MTITQKPQNGKAQAEITVEGIASAAPQEVFGKTVMDLTEEIFTEYPNADLINLHTQQICVGTHGITKTKVVIIFNVP